MSKTKTSALYFDTETERIVTHVPDGASEDRFQPINDDVLLDPETREKRAAKEEQHAVAQCVAKLFFDTHGSAGLSPKSAIDTLLSEFTREEVARLYPQAVQGRAIEAQEPILLLTNLFERVDLAETGEAIFPIFGAISDHQIQDVGESQEYPEVEGFTAVGTIIAKTGRVGLAASFTEDLLASPNGRQFMSMVVRQMGFAFARKKERKAANIMKNQGTTIFDNADNGYKNTTGVDITGTPNGTITQDDLLEMAADLQNDGYTPNVILMHPFAWFAFLKNPSNRSMAQAIGQSGITNSSVSVPRFDGPEDALARLALPASKKVNSITATVDLGLAYPQAITFVISPYLPYTAAAGSNPALADVLMADSRAIGYLLQRQNIVMTEFAKPEVDLQFMKMSERYAFMLAESGAALRVAKNVAIKSGLDPWHHIQFTDTIDGSWGGSTAIF